MSMAPSSNVFFHCFDPSLEWNRSMPLISALTMLDSMAPVFFISYEVCALLCTVVHELKHSGTDAYLYLR